MSNPSVLVIHNRYQQPGGEDVVVRAEVAELRRRGHRVIEYTRDNAEIADYGPLQKVSLPLSAIWNLRTTAELRSVIRRERPAVAHVHNFFPLVSPAAHHTCKSMGVPVMQTLHNYRLLCPAATLYAHGQRCANTFHDGAPCIRRACYRNSRSQTAAVCGILAAHRLAGSWQRCVDAYFVPSDFCRERFAAAGLPANKIAVKHNSLLEDPGPRASHGDYALFIGRLSPEKGVLEMVRAWAQLPDVPLLIAGDGPLRAELERVLAGTRCRVKLLGHLEADAVVTYLEAARFLIFPSRWYEPFGMALLEAAARGVPAIASRIGAVPELVTDGKTGLLFGPENFDQLIGHVRWAWSHPAEMEQMGRDARRLYLQNFTPDKSYQAWIDVCRSLLN